MRGALYAVPEFSMARPAGRAAAAKRHRFVKSSSVKSLPLGGKVLNEVKRMRGKRLLRSPYPLPTQNAPAPLAKSVVVTFCPQKVTKKGRWFPRQRTPRLKDPTAGP